MAEMVKPTCRTVQKNPTLPIEPSTTHVDLHVHPPSPRSGLSDSGLSRPSDISGRVRVQDEPGGPWWTVTIAVAGPSRVRRTGTVDPLRAERTQTSQSFRPGRSSSR